MAKKKVIRSSRPVFRRMTALYVDQIRYWEHYHCGNLSQMFREIMDERMIPLDFHEDVYSDVSKLILAMLSGYNTEEMTIKDLSLDLYDRLSKDYVITPFQIMYFLVDKKVY